MNKLWANITKIIWTQEGQIMLNQKVSNMHLCFNFSKLYWPNSSNFASNLIRLHSQNVIRQNNLQIEYLLRGKNTIWKEKVICFAWLLLFYWIQQEYLTERVPFDLLGCWQQDNYLRLQKRRTAVSLLFGAWHFEAKTWVTLLLWKLCYRDWHGGNTDSAIIN